MGVRVPAKPASSLKLKRTVLGLVTKKIAVKVNGFMAFLSV